jgi:methionyl-tRNA formyltransferase
MRIAILTTDTKHHNYFINKVDKKHDIACVVYEKRKCVKSYKTGPFFDKEQDFYEEKFFQNGVSSELSENLKRKTINIYSVNCKAFQRYLEYLNVDLAVSFGVGLIKDYIFKTPRHGIINMHRGISESYRGMESDLWAIYNRDFENLGVTIHFVDETLDTGFILAKQNFKIEKNDEIYHLRYKWSILGTELIEKILNDFETYKNNSTKQKRLGKYYSIMPIDKKYKTLQIFNEHKKTI